MGLYAYGKKHAYANAYDKGSQTWYQRFAVCYFHWWRDVPRESYLDDDIEESLDDAYSNGEGRSSGYYLRLEFKHRQLVILPYSWVAIIIILSIMVGAIAATVGLALR